MKDILDSALVKAVQASDQYYADVLGGQDQMMCGFAWVVVYGVRVNSKVGKELKAVGFRRNNFEGGLVFWNPAGYLGQNVDAKLEGAREYAKVLRDAGFDAKAFSRLD